MIRRAMVGGALMLLTILAGCRGGDSAGASEARKVTDDYEITQIVTKWHEALSTKNLDLAMSLFADDAVLTAAGKTHSGKDEIRKFLSTQVALRLERNWTALTHTPSIRHTITRDRGTVYFECHFFDIGAHQLVNSVSGDGRVVRIDNTWLFASLDIGNAILG
jgi:hypothetical protein